MLWLRSAGRCWMNWSAMGHGRCWRRRCRRRSPPNAFQGAQAEWDQTSSPGYFGESTTSFDPEIPVHDGSYSGSYWAQVGWSCDSDGTYSGNEVSYLRFDTSDMSGLTTSQREKVAMHELGHTYGLGHVTSSYCRVMEQGTDKFSCSNLPDSDAVNGVNALY